MAKIYHVRLRPSEAKPIILLARQGDWSFNRAGVKLIEAGGKSHPLLRRKQRS